jgi:hypothetical protein
MAPMVFSGAEKKKPKSKFRFRLPLLYFFESSKQAYGPIAKH